MGSRPRDRSRGRRPDNGRAGPAETVLANWARDPHPSEFDHEIGREIDRIDRAIIKGDVRVLMEYGGLQAAMKRQRRACRSVRAGKRVGG